ncbi:MAG: hypothetical protein KJ698_06490 [Actinobacteria bacterium]|nr:hypothetical protein [Actinomycetota bacterium]MBU1494194.1 hypothetical protein [Actinomycetota bacterium]MBU1865946.1 hypothetical protein [Actinomycetota bacterium]
MSASSSRSMPAVVAALIIAWLAVLPAAPGEADATATVRILAAYADAGGVRHDLAGVEVWILEDYGIQRFACTDAGGVAVFTGVTPDVVHTAGMGPSYNQPRCANAQFVNPIDGRKMYSVVYNNHHGVLPLEEIVDGFYPVAGQVTKIPLAARDARRQIKVCGGLRTTWVGTNGDDVFPGTPGSDVVNARGGNDILNGGKGVDYLCGGKGNDVIEGGRDGDVVLGESGKKDFLSGNDGFDILDGGEGTFDRCRGELLFDCER